METITWVPGAIGAGGAITIPTTAPDIDAVVAAEICRLPSALAAHLPAAVIAAIDDHPAADVVAAVDVHPQADIVGALDDHAVHSHDFVSQGLGLAPAQVLGMPVGLNAIEDDGAAALHTVAAAAATGVVDNALPQAHGVGLAPVGHVAVPAAPVGHVQTAVAVAHAGADPVIATTPAKLTARTFTLTDDTLVGDLLSLSYVAVGERVLVS